MIIRLAVRSDFTNAVLTKNFAINPGMNCIELKTKATRVGTWSFKQLSIKVDGLEFLSESLPIKMSPFEIIIKAASANLSFKDLVAGIVQPVRLIISGGSFIFPKISHIHMKCSKHLQLRLANPTNEAADFSTELAIQLENLRSFEEREIAIEAICDLPGQRDEKHIEHIVSLLCPWSRTDIHIPLHFMPPISASCRLHSSETRKFLQVIIKGIESQLSLTNAEMTCDCKGVNLKFRNPSSQKTIEIRKGLNVSYLWEIEVEPLKAECELPVVKVHFNVQYKHTDSAPGSKTRHYSCKFDVQDYTTLFRVQAKVEPSELCRVGSVCHLNLQISKIQDSQFMDLMYEVLADQNTWAVCGRSAGVVSMRDVEVQSIILDVLPLSAGFLPMPNIRLSKYIAVNKLKSEIHPKLQPFPPGQVYNATKSIQIHVLASNNNE